ERLLGRWMVRTDPDRQYSNLALLTDVTTPIVSALGDNDETDPLTDLRREPPPLTGLDRMVIPHVKDKELIGNAYKNLKTATYSMVDHHIRPRPVHVWTQRHGGSVLDAHR
ncbi:hypothetical protein ACTXL8_18415, partial [Glutamicibacter arilaitensis]